MELKHLLALGTIVTFVIFYILNLKREKAYLTFLLLMIPFIDLNVTPEKYGSISVFDSLSFFIIFPTFRNLLKFSKNRFLYTFLFFFLITVIFIGAITSEFVQNATFNFIKILSIFIYCKILIAECIKDSKFVNTVIYYLKIGSVLSLVFLLIQISLGMKFTFYPDLNPNIFLDYSLRYPSFFQDPQKYAQYLSMTSFLFLMKTRKKASYFNINFLIFLLILGAIFLTGSRAAFLGLAFGIVLFIFTQKIRIWLFAIVIGLFASLLLVKYSASLSLLNRTDDYQSSMDTRSLIWKNNLNIFFTHPLLGIGIGNLHNYIVSHSTDGYYIIDNEVIYHGTESGYLQFLIEIGIIGFSILLFFLILPIIKAIIGYRKISYPNLVLLILPIFAWMISFATVNSLGDKRILLVLITYLSLLIFLDSSKIDNVQKG
jgi:O-antigen ligase